VPPFVKNLGLGTLVEWQPGYARKVWPVDPRFFTGADVFGGYLAALADQMLALSSLSLLEEGQTLRTTSLHVDFFRPVSSGEVVIEGRVIDRSKKLIHVEVTFRNDSDQLAAKARGTLFVVEQPGVEIESRRALQSLWERAEEAPPDTPIE
jgi:uncharacterized protein (TIGR00369 family)